MFQRVTLSVLRCRMLSSSYQQTVEGKRVLASRLEMDGLLARNYRGIHTTTASRGDSSTTSPTTPSSTQQADLKKLSNEDWAEKLSPEAYFCTREGGTEPPFSGQYVNHKAEGVYKCVCCGSELFTSKTKYDSGSGWPSFYAPSEEDGVIRRKDISHGMVRLEILCANCNSHLGHVFEDGPQPTGERFCVNSVCLKFAPKKLS